jgi:hypothetical protein
MVIGKHGVTTTTPEYIAFGAGTYHKNFKWNTAEKKWEGVCVGATSGGGKLSLQGEYIPIELDGAHVLVKGMTVKQGGSANMEINMAELSGDNLKMLTNFKKAESSDAEGYDLYTDKADLEEGDYIENFAFVGKTVKGKNIIVIFEWALCTEAFELESKNKENAVLKAKLNAYAENGGDLDTLPVKIYYPTATT